MPIFNPTNYVEKTTALHADDGILIFDSEDSNEIKYAKPDTVYPAGAIVGGCENGVIPASSTRYLPIMAWGTPDATELDTQAVWPVPGNLSYFVVRTRSAQPGTGSLVFTVRVASADTSLVVTVDASAAAGNHSDTTHVVPITFWQGLSIKVVNNASSDSAQIAVWTIKQSQ